MNPFMLGLRGLYLVVMNGVLLGSLVLISSRSFCVNLLTLSMWFLRVLSGYPLFIFEVIPGFGFMWFPWCGAESQTFF